MNYRDKILQLCKVAGYDDDTKKFMRLMVENKVKREDCEAAFNLGRQIKEKEAAA
jgi:hypothetical protein